MGCGASSQSVGVVESAAEVSRQKNFETKTKSDHLKLIPLPIKKNTSAGTQDSGITSHFDSDDEIPERRGSLSSDSDNFITEHSSINLVNQIESEFMHRDDLELSVVGKGCPPLLSDKEKQTKNKNEELESIEMLKSNGLVPKPVVMNNNFALFEIVEDNESFCLANRAPPSRLAVQKQKTTLTAEKIKQRLEKADRRKKENMKIKAGTKCDVESSEMLERQMRLKELRDRLKTKGAQVALSSPRSKELFNELDKFRPKTASNFRPEF
ncbi:DNA ligase 1-like [Brachionus plicatilis]|uniref:DNA ligase 1-like n=1 Tax=Brachionus plicatilis TaxID=10195 RepID=A0A3M7RY62_BRAPC|nr:DNA ligase 1-like [Brachionus plicatilis]